MVAYLYYPRLVESTKRILRIMDDEKQFVRKLAKNDPDLDKPEIAVEFARLLMAHERFKDAQKVIRTALEEGPRYDLYELRAASTHSNLEELWKEVHEKLGREPERTSVNIYNEGLKTPDPDWKAMLSTLDGN